MFLLTLCLLVQGVHASYLYTNAYSSNQGDFCKDGDLFLQEGRKIDTCYSLSPDDGSYILTCDADKNTAERIDFFNSDCSSQKSTSTINLGSCDRVSGVAIYDTYSFYCSKNDAPWENLRGVASL